MDTKELVKALSKVLEVAHADDRGYGTMPCPVCNGEFHYRVSSYNGHVHGSCNYCDFRFFQ